MSSNFPHPEATESLDQNSGHFPEPLPFQMLQRCELTLYTHTCIHKHILQRHHHILCIIRKHCYNRPLHNRQRHLLMAKWSIIWMCDDVLGSFRGFCSIGQTCCRQSGMV